MILAFSAILLLTRPGAAQDCQHFEHDARKGVIYDAPTCDKAKERFGDCAYGASGDVSLGEIVIEKCEGDFLNKLSTGQRRAYLRGIKACDAQYENMQGTMYVAMAAGCRI